MSLSGLKVALLETRMGSELATLIRRQGGEPACYPALREVTVDIAAELRALLDALAEREDAVVVLSSGVGAVALFDAAERLSQREALRQALRRSVTVCRGPKPAGVLSREGVPVSVRVPEPHTTADVVTALEQLPLAGHPVVLLHYGERNRPLVDALAVRGAQVLELLVYEWRLPEDLRPLRTLARALVGREVGAVAFTSQIQVRHLLLVAAELGLQEAVLEALRGEVVVAVIGPTCAGALLAVGVTPDVVPEHPKMGPLVHALAAYVSRGAGFSSTSSP